VVLCDPGGCSGNVAGYDEPRFYGSSAAFYSAAIREMDTIFGRDDKLEQKVCSAAAMGTYRFIALVGTPVVSIIGTDLHAVAKNVEQATGHPCLQRRH
jgi:nitrogenase molybdenum-cofactor synthesis protein NifE